jgi:hypothetical protein
LEGLVKSATSFKKRGKNIKMTMDDFILAAN